MTGLTVEDWNAMPEDACRRLELVDGVLVPTPSPDSRHQFVLHRLCGQLDDRIPHAFTVFPRVDVVLGPTTVRAPDAVVVRSRPVEEYPPGFRAGDVVVAVEIVSPESARTDREVKLSEYADAGIRHYWLLEPGDPITLTAFTLVDGEYEHVAGGTGKVEVPGPFPVTLDLPALVTR